MKQLLKLIDSDPILKQKQEILKTIPGIGDIIAFELLVLLLEFGCLDRRKIASLCGLAPTANDSGQYHGYRKTYHDRNGIKPILFLAAMAAKNSESDLKRFYENLIARGKEKMVDLTALMRKLLGFMHAVVKNNSFWNNNYVTP